MARQTGAAVLNVVAIPERRWVVSGVWDRFQVPKPFTRVNGYFGKPLFYRHGEGVEAFRLRIETQLSELEMQYDTVEAHEAASVSAAS